MPSPKSGKAGSVVKPAKPDEAYDADSSDPGEVAEIKTEQIENKKGKYGSEKVESFTKQDEEQGKDNPDKSWIEIELVDEEDKPVAGEKYEIKLPDGKVSKGSLDQKGSKRIEGIAPGTCQINFPDLDKSAWNKS